MELFLSIIPLRKTIEEMEIMHEDKVLKVTISMGCAEFPKHGTEKDALIEKADQALYNSKKQGRNYVSTADDLIKSS